MASIRLTAEDAEPPATGPVNGKLNDDVKVRCDYDPAPAQFAEVARIYFKKAGSEEIQQIVSHGATIQEPWLSSPEKYKVESAIGLPFFMLFTITGW